MDKLLRGFLGLSVLVIENVQSRRSISACANPSSSIRHAGEICSGNGECHKTRRGPDWCECDLVNRDGDYDFSGGQRLYGKWCQCNPWNCIPTDFDRLSWGRFNEWESSS